MNDIEQVHVELSRLESKLAGVQIERNSTEALKLQAERLRYGINQLQNKLLQKIWSSNNEIENYISENQKLLCCDVSPISVSKTGQQTFGQFSNIIQGRIHSNGFLYGRSDLPLKQFHKKIPTIKALLFGYQLVPTSYTGFVSVLGNFNLRVSGYEKVWEINKCPMQISAQINSQGNISAKVVEYENKTGGTVFKLIFDPFAGNIDSRNAFQQNKTELIRLLNKERMNL